MELSFDGFANKVQHFSEIVGFYAPGFQLAQANEVQGVSPRLEMMGLKDKMVVFLHILQFGLQDGPPAW